MYLPDQTRLTRIDEHDPLPYYYSPFTGWIYRARLEAALSLLEGGGDALCLEVGYGSGILLPELARRYPKLAGVDFHRRGNVVRAMLDHQDLRVPLAVGDIAALPLPSGSCGTVICLSVLEHLEAAGLRAAAREMARVLKPDGLAVAGFPVRNPVTDAFFRIAGFAPRDLHPSSHDDITAALGGCLQIEAWRTVPVGVPRSLASYWVCRARPRR